MSTRLAWIAASGIGIGAVCFGVAMAIGGRSVLNHLDDFDFSDSPRCGVTLTNTQGTRDLDWSGSDRVVVDLPANIHYQRGQGDRVTVTGDSAVVPLVEVDDNHIKLNCHMRRFGQRLDITLPGRDFQTFTINGSASLNLAGIDQPRLRVRVNGSGDVTAAGRTDELEYSMAGSGEGHFENLDAGRVSISVAGSGDADVSPRERLEVNIAGSGKVTLHSEPRRLETHIAGSGRIIHTDGSVTRKNGLSMSDDNENWRSPAPPAPPEPPSPPEPPRN
jgi:hypothetical protein